MKKLLFFMLMLLPCVAMAEKFYTTLDVPRPGKITFPANVEHVLLLNNTVAQPVDYGHKIQLAGEDARQSEIALDSAALFYLAGVSDALQNIGYFASVGLLERSQNKSGAFFVLNRPTTAQIDSLCQLYEVDAILSLNRLVINDLVTDEYVEDDEVFAAALDVQTVANWSVHYPHNSAYESLALADTLFWENQSSDRRTALAQLPERSSAAIDAALYAGQRVPSTILPRWEQVYRYFYQNKDKNLVQGMDSVRHRAWQGAVACWQVAYTSAKKVTTRAYAANNIAAAYEIMGDLDKAIEYANASMLLFSGSQALSAYEDWLDLSAYLEELNQRKREEALLKGQM